MPSSRHLSFALVSAFAFSLAGCGPVSAALHDPHDLPALRQDPRVRYDENAKGYAERIAQLLPKAIARVEAAQGRPFGKSFIVAAYMDDDAYAAANGFDNAKPRGVTFFDRVTMSPAIWREEPAELEAYLTHELSHEHLMSHLAISDYLRIPNWFQEGLAVLSSSGGGAQRVSIEEARREIVAGRVIDTPDAANAFWLPQLAPPPPRVEGEDLRTRMHMAYRQAGMFVSFMREHNPKAYAAFLDRLLNGEQFKTAFETSYGTSVAEMRARFLAAMETPAKS